MRSNTLRPRGRPKGATLRLDLKTRNEIDELWPKIRDAFAFYGRNLSSVCGPSRRKIIEKRLSEGYEPDDIVKAVHGYVHFHEGMEPCGEFNPRKWFDPETVFKSTRFDTRVEMGDEPWVKVDPKLKHEQAVRARQEAAQRRLDEARARMESFKLKAV